jgi:hypothetical protein
VATNVVIFEARVNLADDSNLECLLRAGPDDDFTDEIWEDAMPATFVFADHAQVIHGFLFDFERPPMRLGLGYLARKNIFFTQHVVIKIVNGIVGSAALHFMHQNSESRIILESPDA